MNSPNSVSDQVGRQALAAVESHPLHKEAIAWPHCVSDVFEKSKAFIDGLRLPEGAKPRILSALTDAESVLVVSYWTSERKPEPLSGGGKHYAFFVHPHSFVVLHGGVGTWRS